LNVIFVGTAVDNIVSGVVKEDIVVNVRSRRTYITEDLDSIPIVLDGIVVDVDRVASNDHGLADRQIVVLDDKAGNGDAFHGDRNTSCRPRNAGSIQDWGIVGSTGSCYAAGEAH
jgi:hypothetical protein